MSNLKVNGAKSEPTRNLKTFSESVEFKQYSIASHDHLKTTFIPQRGLLFK
jgi:hypothetical protein